MPIFLFSTKNKNKIKKKIKRFSPLLNIVEFSRFSLVGIFATLLNLITFLILIFFFSSGLVKASIIGYIFGFLVSFSFGREWILSSRHKLTFTTILKFVSTYILGSLIMILFILIAYQYLKFGIYISWLLATLPTAFLNFNLLKFWVFSDRRELANQRWGGLSKLQFLQSFASNLIAYINPAVTHNLEKYYAIKKVFYLSTIEDINGDYVEFGVFEGSSFSHSIRCYLNLKEYMPPNKDNEIKFYGFDSFDGFGKLNEEDFHPFYADEQFKTSISQVNNRIKKCAEGTEFKLIPGFFDKTLSVKPNFYGIRSARIIFIDTDTFSSSLQALEFCKNIIIDGTYIILDDFYSYKGSISKGVAGAFHEFKNKYGFYFREVFSYGMGGKVFVCAKTKNKVS
tara:strand:- start:21972 stop:23162 length:1191 start_codon:yes stop_codon:yes gene_type:complete